MRALALGAAAATALALGVVAPAGADDPTSPWSQHRADADGSLQGVASAPEDPGLRWLTRIDDYSTADAPEGFRGTQGNEAANRPLIGPDGTLVLRGRNQEVTPANGRDVMLGIDPADGSLSWELPFIRANCTPVFDRQDRLWVMMRTGELAAFDASTGEEIAGTRFEPETDCSSAALHLGGTDDHLVIFRDISNGNIEAIDVSGPTPVAGWEIELGDDGPFDDVLHLNGHPHRGLVTDDAVVVATRTGEDDDAVAELVALSLDDGEVVTRAPLPTFEGGAARLRAAQLVRSGDTLVVGMESDDEGYLAAFDLADDFAEQWVVQAEELSGPTQVTLGDGVVFANDGSGEVAAYDLGDGSTVFDGVPVIELGGFVAFSAVADADGRLLTMTPSEREGGSDIDQRAVTAISPDGAVEWRATRLAIRQAANLVEDDIGGSLQLGPIAADGTLYVFREETIIALDDSGGLDVCELPFDDVDEDVNVHAGNICRLVDEGITAGIDESNYGPGLSVTRQQMATFLTRALDLPTRDGDEFDDVDPDSVHAPNIYAIKDAGITAGVTETEFDPTGRLPREQMATFLARAAGLDPVDGSGFDDVSDDSVHQGNIYAVRDADITQGISASRFAPARIVQRDQMASFLIRMVDFLAGDA